MNYSSQRRDNEVLVKALSPFIVRDNLFPSLKDFLNFSKTDYSAGKSSYATAH